jgi:hypothetical protein
MNLPVRDFFKDAGRAAGTGVHTILRLNPKLNAPNVSNPGFPAAFAIKVKISRLSIAKLLFGS